MNAHRILLHNDEEISEFLYQATGMIPGYTQFSTGAAKLEYLAVDLDGVTLLWATGRAHCRWQDQMADDGRVHFGFLLSAESGATSMGHELGPNDAMLFRPGQEMDYVFKGPVETLEIGVSKELADELGWTFSGAPLANIPGPTLTRLAGVCRRASESIATQGDRTRSVADSRAAVLGALERALFPWMPDTGGFSIALGQSTNAHKILQSFDSYITDIGDAMADLTSVSGELGIGRRTLFYALRQTLGITPRKYIEVRRLGELRGRLKQAHHDMHTVTEVATELGFGDLGRMAGKYRRQFGEYPSETLRS